MTQTRTTGTLRCGHCGNVAPMKVVCEYEQTTRHEDEEFRSFSFDEGDVYELLQCPSCRAVTLWKYYWHSGQMDGTEIEPTILFPASNQQQALPDRVGRAWQAAMRVRSVDPNAYAVLLGRLLEIICDDRKAEGGTLHAKMESLAQRGEVPHQIVKIMHGLRKLRNLGAHASIGELSEREIPVLDELARVVLEYVYNGPDLIRKAEERYHELTKRAE